MFQNYFDANCDFIYISLLSISYSTKAAWSCQDILDPGFKISR